MMMENLLYSKSTDLNMKMKVLVAQLCLTLCNPMVCSLPGSSVHGDSPGKNTGVGCHALLTQGSDPHLVAPALQADSLPLSHQRSPCPFISPAQKQTSSSNLVGS